jgi:hypothetical protein
VSLAVGPYTGAPAEWDDFAGRQRGSTLCHRHDWRSVIEGTFGHQCLWLAARDGPGAEGPLRGILPLVRVRSVLFGHYLVSLPFLNYGGPLGDAEAVGALAGEAVRQAERDGVRLLELRSRIELPLDLIPSHRKVTVVLDLPSTPEELSRSFPSKLRSQVRRPFKEGLAVRFGTDQVGPFYSVFSRHMRDLGTPVMPRRFFEAAASTFGGDAWFGCAYLGEARRRRAPGSSGRASWS